MYLSICEKCDVPPEDQFPPKNLTGAKAKVYAVYFNRIFDLCVLAAIEKLSDIRYSRYGPLRRNNYKITE